MTHGIMLGPLGLTFYRTCRVPRAKGLVNDLPAGTGTFPVFRVADYASKAPEHWKREGHFFPMYPQEAMWIGFNRPETPVALLVGAGMVNAVTGKKLESRLVADKDQNYLVVPPQPWLDGFKRSEGESVFQFVAAELGKGETAEEQILGTAEFGGIQIGVYTSKVPLIPATRPHEFLMGGGFECLSFGETRGGKGVLARDMGLGAGGAIKQKVYPDPYLAGRSVTEVWADEPTEKAYVYIVHANDFEAITGQKPPATPITYQFYQQNGYPWFGLPDGSWGDVEGGGKPIEDLKPVSGGPDPVKADIVNPNPINKDLW